MSEKQKGHTNNPKGKNTPPAKYKEQTEALMKTDEGRQIVKDAISNSLNFFNVGLKPVKSNEELCERLNYFFNECNETEQIPSVEKMCLCLGYCRSDVYNMTYGRKDYKWVTTETPYIIKKAKELIASVDAELAARGKIQPVVYIFRSKNYYGMKDNVDYTIEAKQTVAESDPQKLIHQAESLPDE